MVMNKQKGNMYGFVTHTWNPIKGECPHDCSYCYMKRFPQGKLRVDEKALKDKLGEGNFIFVGSSTDIFCKDIPKLWVERVLLKCRNYAGNTYLFQTKAPHNFWKYSNMFPKNSVFCTTLETNRDIDVRISLASSTRSRTSNMNEWFMKKKMVTIEPIMDFDLMEFIDMIKKVAPDWVNIGADSKGHNLPEPSPEKIQSLITELKKFTEVKIKPNLNRLLKPNQNE